MKLTVKVPPVADVMLTLDIPDDVSDLLDILPLVA